MPHNLGDHPDIANALLTGYPDARDTEIYHCPLCGAECECVFMHKETGDIVGCEICIKSIEPSEIKCL